MSSTGDMQPAINNAEASSEPLKKRKTRWGDMALPIKQGGLGIVGDGLSVNMMEPIKLVGPLPHAAPSTTPESLAAAAAAASLVTGRPIQPCTGSGGPGSLVDVSGGFSAQQFLRNASRSAQEILEKTRRAALVQRQIQAQIAAFNIPDAASPKTLDFLSLGSTSAIRPLKFDKYGREIDDLGNLVETKPHIYSTLKINIKNQIEKTKKNEIKANYALYTNDKNSVDNVTQVTQNKWFDPNLCVKKRKKRGLNFIEEGTFIKRERQMQKQAESKALGINMNKLISQKNTILKEQDDAAKLKILSILKKKREEKDENIKGKFSLKIEENNIDVKIENNAEEQESDDEDEFNPNLIPLGGYNGGPIAAMKQWDDVPDFEDWDKALIEPIHEMDNSVDSSFPYKIKFSLIDDLIEHPVIMRNPEVHHKDGVIPNMYLTIKERKKLRRRKRQDKERDKQDKVRMGLIPAPPIRVKLSNLMRVLSEAAAADPSKVEKDVRNQMESRLKSHEERNEARRLTPAERRHKAQAKWKQVDANEFQALFFIVHSLANKRHMFKVDINAQQLFITGCCIVCPLLPNVVIAEGGPRAAKKFKKLLLSRIKWEEREEEIEENEDSDEDDIKQKNKSEFCRLIWEGGIRSRNFSSWKVCSAKTEEEVKQIFKNANAEHYWSMINKVGKTPSVI